MAEFAELEQRMTKALARISAGLERWPEPGVTPSPYQAAQIAHLQQALDAERVARVTEREALAATTQPDTSALQAEVDRLTRQLDAQALDNQRLRSSVAQLREEVRRLREAAEPGLADAALVNRAMQAELESLRAARASETTEISDILAALAPLIETEEAHAHA